jgi:hypothetical protein
LDYAEKREMTQKYWICIEEVISDQEKLLYADRKEVNIKKQKLDFGERKEMVLDKQTLVYSERK